MTLAVKLWAVDGQNNLPANICRLMLRSATRNGRGIVEIGDLRVEELDVPGTAVVVRDGAFIVRGAEDLWQGSYWGYNIGDEQVALTATSSAGPRSDLLYLRIEDPGVANATWDHNPDSDPKAYLVVQEGVSANTKDIPTGKSGIPLALITRPASTGTVLQEHITDLRKMCDARREIEPLSVQGIWDGAQFPADTVGNTTTFEDFPNGAEWDVEVPEWAAQADIVFSFNEIQNVGLGGDGTTQAGGGGQLRVILGSDEALATKQSWYHIAAAEPLWSRHTIGGGSRVDIPQAVRGTTITVHCQGKATNAGTQGELQADGGSGVTVMIIWREVPRYDVPDRSPQ